MKYVVYYLLLINAVGFLLMLIDKEKAKHNAWRIPEAALLTTAAIGGSIGALTGMYLVRHKTRHLTFTLGIPAIIMLQVIVAVFLLIKA